MIAAEQQFARSEMALRQTGYMVLIQSLGYADAIRFLLQLSPGEGTIWNGRIASFVMRVWTNFPSKRRSTGSALRNGSRLAQLRRYAIRRNL